jgi:hypothetical protein
MKERRRQEDRFICTGSEGYSTLSVGKEGRKWTRGTGCRRSGREVDRKCRLAAGKKRGTEAYRKGGLSLGKEGESGQEVWDICKKRGKEVDRKVGMSEGKDGRKWSGSKEYLQENGEL